MHPHWYSTSPDLQRRLISLFILSLAPKSPITTLSPTPSSPQIIFNTELEYTRSPHDIAAVLRWALRHVRLEGDSFGGPNTNPWQWYTAFHETEREKHHPPSAFSEILVPQLPPAHLQLLVSTLELVSSLAAHSERNGISGSKLTKFIGLWLLAAQRTEDGDDWASFYARWERAGRILEHIFLAQIRYVHPACLIFLVECTTNRDEMTRKKMPLRLSELVASYPYTRASTIEEGLLPRPRLSSRRYDALHVRVETQLPDFTTPRPKQHPLRIIADAIKAEVISQSGQYQDMWDAIKREATTTDGEASAESASGNSPTLSRVFADETIRLLSLVPAESSSSVPTIRLTDPASNRLVRRVTRGRSASAGPSDGKTQASRISIMNGTSSTDNVVATKDWSDFSSIGFGDSSLGSDFAKTLLDSDLEKTQPSPIMRKSSRRRRSSPPPQGNSSVAEQPAARNVVPTKSKTTRTELTQLDEAFVDFWSDALLDPIASDWPNFVVCQLKPFAPAEDGRKPINWLILEQVFTRPPPPPEPQPASPTTPNRASSPRPSLRSNISSTRKSATFNAAKRRFTFFSTSPTIGSDTKLPARKKATMSPRVGEMGEILSEEPEKEAPSPSKEAKAVEPKGLGLNNIDVGGGTSATVTGAAANGTQIKTSELIAVPIVEAEQASPAGEGVSATQRIKQDEEPAEEKPTPSIPEDVVVPTDTLTEHASAPEAKPLPPAPEHVVLAGETPGPEVALSTSEPATLAEVSQQLADREAPIAEVAPSTPDIAGSEKAESQPHVVEEPLTTSIASPEVTQGAEGSVQQAVSETVSGRDVPDQDVGTPVSSLPVSGSQSRFVEDLGTDSEETGTGNTADIDVTAEQDSPSRSVQVGGGAESENAKTTENVLASAVSEPEAISQTQVQDVSLPAPAILEQSHSPAEQSAPFVPEEEQPAQEGAEATTEEVSGDVHDGVPETTILRSTLAAP